MSRDILKKKVDLTASGLWLQVLEPIVLGTTTAAATATAEADYAAGRSSYPVPNAALGTNVWQQDTALAFQDGARESYGSKTFSLLFFIFLSYES